MDPLTLVLLMGALGATATYVAATPFDGPYAATRGALGFIRGLFDDHGPVSGWDKSRRFAQRSRKAGADPWSRLLAFGRGVGRASRATGRGASRVGNAAVSGAYRAGRAGRWIGRHRPRRGWFGDHTRGLADWIRAHRPTTTRTTYTDSDLAPTNAPEPAETSAHPAPNSPAADTATDDEVGGGAPTAPVAPTPEGHTAMQLREFTNIDDLQAFVREAIAELTSINEQIAPVRRGLTQFPEQWRANSWGSDDLDKAVSGIGDMAGGLADAEAVTNNLLDQAQAMDRVIHALRGVGEVAASHGAHGDIRGFQPA